MPGSLSPLPELTDLALFSRRRNRKTLVITQAATEKKHLLQERDILISERSVLSTAGWCHAVEYETSTADWSDVLRACPDQRRSCPGNPTQ